MSQSIPRNGNRATDATIYAGGLIDIFRSMGCKPPDDLLAQQYLIIATDSESAELGRLSALCFLIGQYRLAIIMRCGNDEVAHEAASEAERRFLKFRAEQEFCKI